MTAEYAVLDGALALAIPTRYGQRMNIKKTRKSDLFWKAYTLEGTPWFSAQVSLYDFSTIKTSDPEIAGILSKLLQGAVHLNSEFLSKWNGFNIDTYLEFPREWGLGSSSTITHLIAEWADVNPLLLHFEVFEGSGYDVACAGAESALTYQVSDESVNYTEIDLELPFTENLYFIHRNVKASTSAGIAFYYKNVRKRKTFINNCSALTEAFIKCTKLNDFNKLVVEHEDLVSHHLGLTPVKQELFKDFWGEIKSLGAWGGDMLLATSDYSFEDTKKYFSSKGFKTVLPFDELVLKESVPAHSV